MKIYLPYILLIAGLLGACVTSFAQTFPSLRFKHLSTKDGLSDNNITSISEDNNGFIWFGTTTGLNRFDGYKVKQFLHDGADSSSLPDNNISQVVTDARNNLWVATAGGIAYLNINTQKALNFINGFTNPPSTVSAQPSHVYLGKNGNVLITSGRLLYSFDSAHKYHSIEEDVESFEYAGDKINFYNAIVADRTNRLWAFSINRIYLLDVKSMKIVKTYIGPDPINITKMYFDSNNRCWLVTRSHGLYLFNPESGEWQNVNTGSKGLRGCITEWSTNGRKYMVYISESNSGLVLIDQQTLSFKYYKDNAFANPLLGGTETGYVYTDKKNILWIGTQSGVSYVTPSSQLFDVIPVGANDTLPDFFKQKVVFDIYSDKTGYWLSKWYLGGVLHYTKNWQLDKYLPALYPRKALQPNFTSIAFDMKGYKGNMYITTDSGLVEMDTVSFSTTVIQPSTSQMFSTLRTIVPINDTVWWIQSYYSGVYVFNVLTKRFTKHYVHANGCSNCLPSEIYDMFKADDGKIYFCSYEGLFEYRPATDDFVNYSNKNKKPAGFPGDSLYNLADDGTGKLWIGTNKGLCIFNPANKTVETVFVENSLIGQVNAVCMDKWKNVWLGASTGLWCRLADGGKFINLSSDNDMPQNSGDGMLTVLEDGKVYDGCLDAIVRLNPEWLKEYSGAPAKSVITEVSAENKFIPLNTDTQKKVAIPSGTHLFTIDFSLVNYNFISGNRYYYRLLPLSNNWQQNNNGHLTLYDVPPGTYTLEVKGYNDFDRIFSSTDLLVVEIQPLWWQTLWVKLFGILCLAAIIALLVRRRITGIRKQAEILQQQTAFKQKIAETEMQALRAQMNPHFIFNSLNSIENFMMQNDKRSASDYFAKFALLIRMILDSSRNELVPFTQDMEALRLYVELEQLRFNNKFNYQTIVDAALLDEEYCVPPLLIQPFVENAIVHGLSQSEKEGLQLLVTVAMDNGYITYTVQDNGIGRKQSAVYRQNNRLHKSMGMQITKERINVFNHQQQANGEVTITDLHNEHSEPCGTKVYVKIKAV